MTGTVIRMLAPGDIESFPAAFAAQGWHKPREQFAAYLADQEAGRLDVLVAEVEGAVAGYLLIRPQAESGPFAGRGIAEIADFNVLMAWQRRGIGTMLMDEAERRAGGKTCLGVGLHAGYGPAQRLYVLRGYVPDGSGVCYQDKPAEAYGPCRNDDDLVLYMVKGLDN